MKKIGKIGAINLEANKLLHEEYRKRGIYPFCELGLHPELGFTKCLGRIFLGYAHRHNRVWYRSRKDLLSSYNQTLVACNECHNILDKKKDFREEVFQLLRGSESEES